MAGGEEAVGGFPIRQVRWEVSGVNTREREIINLI